MSYLLTGWCKSNSSKIFIDGLETPINILRNVSCYVGHSHYYDIEPFHKHMSVRKLIETGIKKSNNSITFQDLEIKFDLSAERADRKFDRIGNEHWRASLAIGYAYNKKIYCAPFLECGQWENYYSIMLEKWMNVLKNDGAIILIPTDDEKSLNSIIDNTYYF